jgi:hypothetical protein
VRRIAPDAVEFVVESHEFDNSHCRIGVREIFNKSFVETWLIKKRAALPSGGQSICPVHTNIVHLIQNRYKYAGLF